MIFCSPKLSTELGYILSSSTRPLPVYNVCPSSSTTNPSHYDQDNLPADFSHKLETRWKYGSDVWYTHLRLVDSQEILTDRWALDFF